MDIPCISPKNFKLKFGIFPFEEFQWIINPGSTFPLTIKCDKKEAAKFFFNILEMVEYTSSKEQVNSLEPIIVENNIHCLEIDSYKKTIKNLITENQEFKLHPTIKNLLLDENYSDYTEFSNHDSENYKKYIYQLISSIVLTYFHSKYQSEHISQLKEIYNDINY